jgi:hypothetical protein
MGGLNSAAKNFYIYFCPDRETHIPEFFQTKHIIYQNSTELRKLYAIFVAKTHTIPYNETHMSDIM